MPQCIPHPLGLDSISFRRHHLLSEHGHVTFVLGGAPSRVGVIRSRDTPVALWEMRGKVGHVDLRLVLIGSSVYVSVELQELGH